MKTSKTHYRKVLKSDHLGVADLEDLLEEGSKLVFTISHVKQEYGVTVAGKKGDFNIAYFKEKIKPLVLNAGNAKIVSQFTGSKFVEDWNEVLIELYIDENVKFGRDTVSGVRIRQVQPVLKKKPVFTEDRFATAKGKGASVEDIKKVYQLSPELEAKYKEYAATNS